MTNEPLPLTGSDLGLLLESLRYTRQRFESYDGYPSEDFRRDQLRRVDEVVTKLRSMHAVGED